LPFCVRTVAVPQTVVRAVTIVVLGAAVVMLVKVEFWARTVAARPIIIGTVSFMIPRCVAAVAILPCPGLPNRLRSYIKGPMIRNAGWQWSERAAIL
jgi:hypothetical protein